jgi:hypothetical protein
MPLPPPSPPPQLNENEPAFLRGQTRASRELSPVRIVANPDGSMQRAALQQVRFSLFDSTMRRACPWPYRARCVRCGACAFAATATVAAESIAGAAAATAAAAAAAAQWQGHVCTVV